MYNIGVQFLEGYSPAPGQPPYCPAGIPERRTQFTSALEPGGSDYFSGGGLCRGLHLPAAGHCRQLIHDRVADQEHGADGAPKLAH